MSEPPFSPELRRALDGFAPPPIASGFAERALERVRARGETSTPPLPRRWRRWRSTSPWRRGGFIVGAVASVGLVSAAAAATGLFGEPVEVPVISRIARSLDIVEAPPAPVSAPARAAAPSAATGASAARARIDALIDDPAFRALPPVERRAELRRTAREIVGSGEARPREVIDALRETGRERFANMTPEQREQLVETVNARREARRERIAGTTPVERREARREIAYERRNGALEPEAATLASEPAGVAAAPSAGDGEGSATDGR